MADSTAALPATDEFFRRWEGQGAAERANYSMFLNEVCDLLEVSRADTGGQDVDRTGQVIGLADPVLTAVDPQHGLDPASRDIGHWPCVQRFGYPPTLAIGEHDALQAPGTVGNHRQIIVLKIGGKRNAR